LRGKSDGNFAVHLNGTGDILVADSTGIDVTGLVTAIDADDSSIIAKVSNTSGVRDAYLKFNDGLGTEGHIRYNHYNKYLDINNTETNGWLTLSTENTERVRVDKDGNVGIGTTSPTAKLHSISTGNWAALFESTGSNRDIIAIRGASTTTDSTISKIKT